MVQPIGTRAGTSGTGHPDARFTYRYGPALGRALAEESARPDPVYRPYRADTTDLVPPEPAEPFEPGCDWCGALPTQQTISADGAWYRLCTGHMAAEWINRYAPSYLTREQERYVVESFRRWAR